MMQARLVLALLCLAIGAAAHAQQIYRWTDEAGRTHLTDTPPPANARGVATPRSSGSVVETAQPYELTTAMRDFPVVLYTAPICKEACDRARDALNKRGVPFREVQVWDEATNEELKKVSGSNEVPTLLVGRSVNKGFQQEAYDTLLDSARYPKAGTVAPRAQAAPAPPEGYSAAGGDTKAEPAPPPIEEREPLGPYSPGSRPPPRRVPAK
jgi:glutaredoxin